MILYSKNNKRRKKNFYRKINRKKLLQKKNYGSRSKINFFKKRKKNIPFVPLLPNESPFLKKKKIQKSEIETL